MRTLFPSRSLALHRRLNDANLPDQCVVEVPVYTPDGGGGDTVAWEEAMQLPCRVSPIGVPELYPKGEQYDPLARSKVIFQEAVQLPAEARLRITFAHGEVLLLTPEGSNGPRSYEAQRKYECSLWKAEDYL